MCAAYITDLYSQRKKQECENKQDQVGRTLYKLQANSFDGRFGMNEFDVDCELVDDTTFTKIASSYEMPEGL